MPWPRQLLFRLRDLAHRDKLERELAEELSFHLEMEAADRAARGLSPEEARRAAALDFGGVEKIKEDCRDQYGLRWLETVGLDLRHGARGLRRSPGFTIAALLTLSLGIGANTAIFSVVNAVLIRPLPFADPGRLMRVFGTTPQNPHAWTSPLNFVDLAAQQRSFAGLAALSEARGTLAGADEAEQIEGWSVSANFFTLLGVRPALGRSFTSGEDQPGGECVLVLSHALWQRRFGGQPGAIGRTVALNDTRCTVVGVAPAAFDFPLGSAFWKPLRLDPGAESRGSNHLTLIARLASGATRASAQADLAGIARNLARAYPDPNAGRGFAVVPLREQIVGEVRPALLVLAGAVGLVLLIACGNVANLLLARSAARRGEVAIRAAVGAARARIVRQLLTESLLLALLAGAAGLLLGVWGARLLALWGPQGIPRLHEVSLDGRVLSFTLLTSLATVALFGLAPAVQGARPDLDHVLKEANRGTRGSRSHVRLRGLVIVAELALTVTLMVGSGLLMKSFLRLVRVRPGFEPGHLLTMDVSLPPWRYDRPRSSELYADLLARVGHLPSVISAAAGMSQPVLGANHWGATLAPEGSPTPAAVADLNVAINPVTPDYFRTLGIPLLAGRAFTDGDGAGAPAVAVISRKVARLFFPGINPVDRRIHLDIDLGPDVPQTRVIAGVVGDVHQEGLALEEAPAVYLPHRQVPYPKMSLLVRTAGDPQALGGAVRAIVRDLDHDVPVGTVTTMEEILTTSVGRPRFYTALTTLFAALALFLAAVGVYGVLAWSVSQRLHEIGVRMALGADRWTVESLIIRQAMAPALLGLLLGLGAALTLSRTLATLLYGVEPTDPWVYALVSGLLLAVVLLASHLPARQATRLDLTRSLRCE
ncbi:MAG TPA: ABC transporter permease [Thermoanaerobaculia bacterium]|nr:ABC transporter permease [Thermoanaerobaculia bacterium]